MLNTLEMINRIRRILFIFFIQFSFIPTIFAQLSISQLQCEYQKNPLGIDELHPRFSWRLTSENSKTQTAYRILVSSSIQALSRNEGDLWDTGIKKSAATNNIIYQGKSLDPLQKYYWKVRTWDEQHSPSNWSEIAFFTIGPLEIADWPAEWIGPPPHADKEIFPIFSKTFPLEQIPANAYMYVNALGYFELFVNGKKVSRDILSPSTTDYSKHTLYVTYDIKAFLKEGRNTITLWMAHGWHRLTRNTRYYGVVEEAPLVRAFAHLHYPDRTGIIPTDRSWGFVPSNRQYTGSWEWGNFGGEKVNLSKQPDLNHNDSLTRERVDNYKIHHVPAIAQRNNPTQIIDSMTFFKITEIGNETCLVDFGKHVTGFLRFEFDGTRTDSIKIEYIDKIVNKDSINDGLERYFTTGFIDEKKNIGFISYNQYDLIIPAQKEREVFINKFNYHGFRWIKITGISQRDIIQIDALQISEKNKQIASFECSNPLLNKIWKAVVHTYRCINYNGYVVDCPHRERGGYGGDSHSSLETALSIFDVAPLCNKWTLDWNAAQYATGLWPHTVPEFPSHKNKFSPGWGGLGMFLPWQFYKYHGDTVNLKRAYPYIKKWIAYMESNTVNGILYQDKLQDKNDWRAFHGDWIAPNYGMGKNTRVDDHSTLFFNNCFYLYELDMATRIATLLGKIEDAKYFSKLYTTSKPIIHEEFYDTDNKWYANGEQPYQAFPLLIDLMPDALKPEMEDLLEYLIVEKNDGHLNTGMLGTYFMLEYLMKAGRGDLIYTMVNQKTFPGWGYMIENGATTIWEQWNGNNSQIHNTYLAIGKWFVQGLGGIKIEMVKPSMPNFIINPEYIEDLEYVDVSYETRFGKIESSWERKPDALFHTLDIPVHVKCMYKIPVMEDREISVNGTKIDTKQNMVRLDPGVNTIRISKRTNR